MNMVVSVRCSFVLTPDFFAKFLVRLRNGSNNMSSPFGFSMLYWYTLDLKLYNVRSAIGLSPMLLFPIA